MDFSCDRCGRRYFVPDELVQGRAFRAKCDDCNHAFVVPVPDTLGAIVSTGAGEHEPVGQALSDADLAELANDLGPLVPEWPEPEETPVEGLASWPAPPEAAPTSFSSFPAWPESPKAPATTAPPPSRTSRLGPPAAAPPAAAPLPSRPAPPQPHAAAPAAVGLRLPSPRPQAPRAAPVAPVAPVSAPGAVPEKDDRRGRPGQRTAQQPPSRIVDVSPPDEEEEQISLPGEGEPDEAGATPDASPGPEPRALPRAPHSVPWPGPAAGPEAVSRAVQRRGPEAPRARSPRPEPKADEGGLTEEEIIAAGSRERTRRAIAAGVVLLGACALGALLVSRTVGSGAQAARAAASPSRATPDAGASVPLDASSLAFRAGSAAPTRGGTKAAPQRKRRRTVRLEDRKLFDLLGRKDDVAMEAPKDDVELDSAKDVLDPTAVERTVAKSRRAFDACVTKALRLNPGLRVSRRATLMVTVEPNGKVTGGWIAEEQIEGTELGRCLVTVSSRMSFPTFEGEAIDVSIPLSLSAIQ